jgi:hypothetical protein
MAKTPNSSSTTYCSPAEFLKRYDSRTVGDLVADDGARVSASALLTDDNLAAALLTASGYVETACFTGNKYAAADLGALTGAGRAFLYQLVSDLVMGLLLERRPKSGDEKIEPPAAYERAWKTLDRLRLGELVFGLVETGDAGVPAVSDLSVSDLDTLSLASRQAGRLFGQRGIDERLARRGW